MQLEKQVVSLELATRLKELGMRQDSLYGWYDTELAGAQIVNLQSESTLARKYGDAIPAFTVAELGEMLPWKIDVGDTTYFLDTSKNGPKCESAKTYSVAYYDGEEDVLEQNSCDTEADARAKILIYLIENKLINLPH